MNNIKCKSSITHTSPKKTLSQSITDYLDKAGSYIGIKTFINNEIRITIGSRLPGKNLGDTCQERKTELQALKIELEKHRLKIELANKKSELFKLRKKFETTGDNLIWDKKAALELQVRELEYLLTGNASDYFQVRRDDSLGITDFLQERSDRSNRQVRKIDFTATRKPSKLSAIAKHRILENCTILDKLHGKNQYLITLTVPGDTPEIKKAIANFSPWIDNLLYQSIRDLKKLRGWNIDYIGVWENHKSGKLHKHIVIANSEIADKQLREVGEKIGVAWEKILDNMGTGKYIQRGNYSGFLPCLDMYRRKPEDIKKRYSNIESWKDNKDILRELKNKDGGKIFVNIQRVRCSVARYLSKYLSKNSKLSKKDSENFNPVRWWQASKNIRDLAASYRLECTFSKDSDRVSILNDAIEYLENTNAITLSYIRYYDIYAIFNKQTGKSERINIKHGEPIPINGRRVSSGCQYIMYYDETRFIEVYNFIQDVMKILEKKQEAIPENKPKNIKLVNKYNDDISGKFDYKIWKLQHKKYWDDLAKNSG